MKFTVERDKLLDVIRKVQAVIDRKTTSTILSNILVSSDPDDTDRIVIVATDFESSFRGYLYAGSIAEFGEFVVNGKSFFEIVRMLGDQDVVISTDENRVNIQSGRSSFALNTFPVEDYPKVPEISAVRFVEFNKAMLAKMIRTTAFSVSQDHSRPNLNGVYFTVEAGAGQYSVAMVSTDGHRLSRISTSVPMPVDAPQVSGNCIVHRKGLGVMKTMLESGEEFCQVGFDERNVIFRVGSSTVSIRPIEETFPEYRKVIPREFPVKVGVSKRPLEEMIRRVSVLNNPQVKAVRVRVGPGVLEASAINPELGEGKDELPIDFDGSEISSTFNYQFFLDMLGVIDEADLTLEFIDSISACRVMPVTPEGDPNADFECMFIVMPMRM